MLATATDVLPTGAEWAFEPKWDGYRALVRIAGGDATLRSRNGNDLTGRFATVAKALASAVRSPAAVLDGEVCALDDAGRSDFGLLQRGEGTLVFVAFDVLERDGSSLVGHALRRTAPRARGPARYGVSPAFCSRPRSTTAPRSRRLRSEHGLEGVVAKKRDSAYHPGRRSPDWRKLKLKHRQELVIAGFTRGKGRRSSGIGSLILGVHAADGVRIRRQRRDGAHRRRARPARVAARAARSIRPHRSTRCRGCHASVVRT